MGDSFLMVIVFCIIIIIGAYFYMENRRFLFPMGQGDLDDNNDEFFSDDPLSQIFYMYNHGSEKEWGRWMEHQDTETRIKASQMLTEHLEGPPKEWGYVTLEVISALAAFQDLYVDEPLGNFFQENARLWGEYKSIPNYYQRAAEVLCEISPPTANRLFGEEFDKKSKSQNALDRRKIILDVLPALEELGSGLIISVINSNHETFTTKAHALRCAKDFTGDIPKQIVHKCLKHHVDRLKNFSREIKTEDSQLVQDLLKDGIKSIGQPKFFKIIRDAAESTKLQKFVIEPLANRVTEENAQITPKEIFAMISLRDNAHNDLRRAIAKKQKLETGEINNIAIAPTVDSIKIEELKTKKIEESKLPIPDIFEDQYNDFKSLFFEAGHKEAYNECEKPYGGILVTGDDDLEKLYFAKAFAKEKGWNFGYINIEDIIDKETYNEVCTIFSTLRKPYLLYIDNIEQMYPVNDGSPKTSYKEKFSQTLYIQSLDTKSFLVGSIRQKTEEINDDASKTAIGKLRTKFLSHQIEMNVRHPKIKHNIVEDHLKYINTHRFDNRADLINSLVELGQDKCILEFVFFVIDTLATMLLVYGRNVHYNEIEKLRDTFFSESYEDDYDEDYEDDGYGESDDEEFPEAEEAEVDEEDFNGSFDLDEDEEATA